MAEAIIFIGLQGSGKTTYFMNHFAASHAHVSRDIQETAEREMAFIRECLRSGRSFVVDNTNATRAARAQYIREAKGAGFTVLCYFFDTPVRTAIGRNNHRRIRSRFPSQRSCAVRSGWSRRRGKRGLTVSGRSRQSPIRLTKTSSENSLEHSPGEGRIH